MDNSTIVLSGKNGQYHFSPNKDVLSKNGRFGSVFKGKNTVTGQSVVVKFYAANRGNNNTEFRFKSEALFAFGRADIQDSIDFISDERGHFLIKNYVSGTSLKNIRRSKIKLSEWKENLLFILDTLDFIHSKGIIHGDIKPANIIWPNKQKEPEKPVLIDFGLARLNKLEYNDSLFSFIYSSPEQQLGMGHLIGPHSDFFSLGILLYEGITDKTAYDFDNKSPMVLEQAQLSLKLPHRKKLPIDWYNLILWMCDKPSFKKPVALYSKTELQKLLEESIARRPKTADELREKVKVLGTDDIKSNFWDIFG